MSQNWYQLNWNWIDKFADRQVCSSWLFEVRRQDQHLCGVELPRFLTNWQMTKASIATTMPEQEYDSIKVRKVLMQWLFFWTRTIWRGFWQKAKRNFCLFPSICLFWCLWKARNETGVLCQQKCWRVPLCVGHFNPPWMIVEKVLLGDSQSTHPTVVPSPLKCLFCKKRKLQFFVCSWKLFFLWEGKNIWKEWYLLPRTQVCATSSRKQL